MKSTIILFISSLLVTLVITPLIRRFAFSWGFVDKPGDYRRVHTRVVPRFGGVGIMAGLVASVLICYLFDDSVAQSIQADSRNFWGLAGASLLVWLTGLIDDLRGLKPSQKALIVAIASIVVYFSGFKIIGINTPFGLITFGILALPLTMVWLVGTSNAINLIDGLDGLAAGVSLIVAVTIFTLSITSGGYLATILTAALAGATLGFLFYNFPPATIFLGDSGSLSLGFLLGATALLDSIRHTAIGFAVPLIIFALPIADTVLAILRRWSKRMPISTADREHIHHRLLMRGLSQKQAVTILYGMSILAGIIAIFVSVTNAKLQIAMIFIIGIVVVAMLRLLKWNEISMVTQRIQSDVHRTRERSEHWTLVNSICNQIRFVKSEFRLSSLLTELFQGIELDRVMIYTDLPSTVTIGKKFIFSFSTSNAEILSPCKNSWTASLEIRHKDIVAGHFYAIKDTTDRELPAEIANQVDFILKTIATRFSPKLPISSVTPDTPVKSESIAAGIKNEIFFVDPEGTLSGLFTGLFSSDGIKIGIVTLDELEKKNFINQTIIAIINIREGTVQILDIIMKLLMIHASLNIIVLVDMIEEDMKRQMYKAGCMSVIQKPIDIESFRSFIKSVA